VPSDSNSNAADKSRASPLADANGFPAQSVMNAGPAPHVNGGEPQVLRCGSVELDLTRRQATRSGRPLRMAPTEFKLLNALVAHSGTVLSREQLVEIVWGQGNGVDLRTVDVTVGRLRRILSRGWLPDPIRTIRGRGYRMEADEAGLRPTEHRRKLRLPESS
jgi:DNA-binding response OmpR family regulator